MVGSKTIKLEAGKATILKIKLNAEGRKLIAEAGELRVTVRITIKAHGRRIMLKAKTLTLREVTKK